ncbi:hypothetical protein [Streptomyces sp. NBRC 110028]|uniref:hypothetical protein n=1 Tax=Streptomyces sp. NBRC 110028 TaxID=1621260 RepID=UPI000AF25CD1|nr:hypothetical protein [Streptomyces sp. NBRC 110028]
MTVRKVRPTRPRRDGVRWARAAVVALFAALAVLVHHQVAAPMTSTSPSTAHTMTAMSMPMPSGGHDAHPRAASATATPVLRSGPVLYGDGAMACGGAGMEHCSASGVDTLKLTAPTAMSYAEHDAAPHAAVSERGVSGTAERAPPDLLSVLSRLRV